MKSKLFTLLMTTTLGLTACETIRGVSTRADSFPKMNNYNCIETAIKSVPQAQFIKYERQTREARSFWRNDEIQEVDHVYRFAIPILEDSRGNGFVSVDESSSPTNEDYNKVTYGSDYGHLNGPNYTDEQKRIAQTVLSDIDQAVKTRCSVYDLSPKTTVH